MDGDIENFLGLDVDLAECLQNCPEWNVSSVKVAGREKEDIEKEMFNIIVR